MQGGSGIALVDLGPQPIACREPINIVSTHRDPQIRLLSNFAHSPLVLAGERYESVEGFWQGLKYPGISDRRRVGQLVGKAAKQAGRDAPPADTFTYQGETIRVGTARHWRLMALACQAKFEQNDAHRAALLATAGRPLTHRVRRDSPTIPGVIMADIWMKIREKLLSKSV
jgi:hypothetical protein